MTVETDVRVLGPREVPLGGVRSIEVRRTLPHRERSFVGAWCFLDHYGPYRAEPGTRGMDVPPHPHTGLQTLSWLFEGEIEHRDSGRAIRLVRPGEVNLMTAGAGIAHSEVSTPATTTLHGVQLWVVLPSGARTTGRALQHHVSPVVDLPAGAGTARVLVGELVGVDVSPVRTFSPLLGAQLDLVAGAEIDLQVDPSYEHAVLLDTGAVTVEDVALDTGALACIDEGRDRLCLRAGDEGARVVLLGGEPFEEEIVMWWNFIGRDHDEVVAHRQAWEDGSEQFGQVPGYTGPTTRIPAPPMPAVRLRPRGRRGRAADRPTTLDHPRGEQP